MEPIIKTYLNETLYPYNIYNFIYMTELNNVYLYIPNISLYSLAYLSILLFLYNIITNPHYLSYY